MVNGIFQIKSLKSFTLSVLIFILACCTQISKKEKGARTVSELSALMREMKKDCQALSAQILQGQKLNPDFRGKFAAIKTAKPTDETTKTESYEAMANDFLEKLDQIYQKQTPEIQDFNALVHSCITCHETHCQGPIKTIEKLYVANP
jgi:cytochrome c553